MTACRHCGAPLDAPVLDLGHAPPCNALLAPEGLLRGETHLPLKLFLCETCGLAQIADHAGAEALFTADYVYRSSASRSWLAHAARFAREATRRLGLGPGSQVVEIASNDGYLLRNFVAAGTPCLGIEPAAEPARAAREAGVPVLTAFFSEAVAESLRRGPMPRGADLVIGNNVFAHAPDINDFARGLARLLAPEGVVSLEFPHVQRLVEDGLFDTVYHEHFSYLSLTATSRIFSTAGLAVFDVEELPTHGGSLRVWGRPSSAAGARSGAVDAILAREARLGVARRTFYGGLQGAADRARDALIAHLVDARREGRRVAAYGAAAKGITLLNYARVGPDLLAYVCDAAASKQGRLLPGCHIPVVAPERLREDPPDDLLILPWNLAEEIASDLDWLRRARGVRMMTLLPTPRALPPAPSAKRIA